MRTVNVDRMRRYRKRTRRRGDFTYEVLCDSPLAYWRMVESPACAIPAATGRGVMGDDDPQDDGGWHGAGERLSVGQRHEQSVPAMRTVSVDRMRLLRRARRDVWWTWMGAAVALALGAAGAWVLLDETVPGAIVIATGFGVGSVTFWLEGTRRIRVNWWKT